MTLGINEHKKKSRLHIVKPDFDVIFAELLIKLSGANYLVYGVNDNCAPVIKVQDCAYRRVKDSDIKFVPRTVKFTVQQWADLRSIGGDICEASTGDDSARVHIGHNTFVTVNPDRETVDIREFFLPQDDDLDYDMRPEDFYDLLHPTKRGVQLTLHGWAKLITTGAHLLLEYADVKVECKQACIQTHTTDAALHACQHCNPNGYHRWV